MTPRIEQIVATGEMEKEKIFLFMDDLVYDSALYKEESKIPLLFEIVLMLNKSQMQGVTILHTIHIEGAIFIEAFIGGLSRINNLGGMMQGLNYLQFASLCLGATERPMWVEPCIRS